MYHVNTQGVDERMINVHYYYYRRAVSVDCFDMFLRVFDECLLVLWLNISNSYTHHFSILGVFFALYLFSVSAFSLT